MAKSAKNEIVKVTPDLALPDYLRDEPIEGMEELKGYVVPPVLKIVQKSAAEDLLKRFDVGTVLTMPTQAIIAAAGEPFKFVPIYFFSEVCVWTPIELRGQVPSVLERTVDQNSPTYQKALDKATWDGEAEYEGRKVKVRYVEHLNFIITLYDHPLAGEPTLVSFSRGEHKTGRLFANLLKQRRASTYGCIFQATPASGPTRQNPKGTWWGLDLANPDDGTPWVTAEEHARFKELYQEIGSWLREGRLRAKYEEDIIDEVVTPESKEF